MGCFHSYGMAKNWIDGGVLVQTFGGNDGAAFHIHNIYVPFFR
jgi:hypothetical protein